MRSAGYIAMLLAAFISLVWGMWSGLAVIMPESEEPSVCHCNKEFHLIAHRGAAAIAPENTIAAIRLAILVSPDVSMDLAMTADRELVLMHDDYVDRTTNSHGLLCEHTLEEVQQLDAGSWFGSAFQGERVPTLHEVFSEFGNTTMYHMDLKDRKGCAQHAPLDMAREVVQVVRAYKLEFNVAFTVEDPKMLWYVKSQLPSATILASINVLYTLAPLSSMWAFVDQTGADGVSAHFLMPMLKNVLAEAKKRRKKVHIYTVDSVYVARWLECLGLDAIVTNFPRKVLKGTKCDIYSYPEQQAITAPGQEFSRRKLEPEDGASWTQWL
eukprot:TRINITY_DN5710_c0_g1_i1.p1 TRINITY_DN5710_c0_g1~~TRINITY_DN5710_c0_g1_i1.p1  ORF type:complete len:326 (+),score=82.24 TRINITY_DN5710_c0_g1_i1:212-1189(+)